MRMIDDLTLEEMATEAAKLDALNDYQRKVIESSQLRAAVHASRASVRSLQESFDDIANFVGPEWQMDDYSRPYGGWIGTTGARVGDRKDGENRPIFESDRALAEIRAQSRAVCAANGLGVSIVEKLTDYIVGDGYQFKFAPANGDESGLDLCQALQQIVDTFIEDNNWQGDADREIFSRIPRDGESFAVVYPGMGGASVLRIIEPEQVVEPPNVASIDGYYSHDRATSWTFGIHTAADDVQKVLGYYVQWTDTQSDFDYLPAGMVVHTKANVDRTIKRGLSDFYPVLSRLSRAEKLLRNTEEGAAIQAAIAYIVEAAQGVNREAAQAAQFTRQDFSIPAPPPSNGRQVSVKRISPGTVLTTPYGQQYKPGPLGSERAPNFILVLQAAQRWIGNRWSMPEFLISGDASNANYASTMVAESPWVKSCQRKQATMKRTYSQIMWKVIANAHAAGLLEKFGYWRMDQTAIAQLKKLVTLNIEAPQLAVRDLDKETTRNKTLHDARVMSLKTWSGREGLNFDDEQEQMETEPAPVDPTLGMKLGPDGKPVAVGDPNEDPNVQRKQQIDDEERKKAAQKVTEAQLQAAADLLWEGYA